MQRLEVSSAVRPLYWSLGVKGLITVQRDATQSSLFIILQVHCTCFRRQPHPSSGVHKPLTTASSVQPSWPRWREVAAQKIWTVPEAVVTVLYTPDYGCGWHPKHVDRTCRIIYRLFCVASHWTIINTVIMSKFTATMDHVSLRLINNYSHITWVAVYHSGCISAFKTQLFSDILFGKSHTITSDDLKLVSVGNNCGHNTCTESTSFLFVPQILMKRSPWKFISGTALEMAARDQWIIKATLHEGQCTISAVS